MKRVPTWMLALFAISLAGGAAWLHAQPTTAGEAAEVAKAATPHGEGIQLLQPLLSRAIACSVGREVGSVCVRVAPVRQIR